MKIHSTCVVTFPCQQTNSSCEVTAINLCLAKCFSCIYNSKNRFVYLLEHTLRDHCPRLLFLTSSLYSKYFNLLFILCNLPQITCIDPKAMSIQIMKTCPCFLAPSCLAGSNCFTIHPAISLLTKEAWAPVSKSVIVHRDVAHPIWYIDVCIR